MGNIAVFGGTFNPIHNEHIRMIRCISRLDFIDKILVIPTHIPPHKTAEYLASDEDRYNMCKIAAEGISKTEVSDFEIKRQGKSYTFYTIEALKEIFANDDFFVVCGADMAITLDTWHRYDELKKLCTFLVIDRPGTDKKELRDYILKLKENGAKVSFIDCDTENVSSSGLRKGMDNSLVPECVADYIREKGLYKNE